MASPTKEARAKHEITVPVPDPPCTEKIKSKAEQVQRAQWLRAAILGANDGLLTTTSLMLGMSATREDHRLMFLSGFAGTVAGACSMAVGEFVSVSTQRDIESVEIHQDRNAKPTELGSVAEQDTGIESQKSVGPEESLTPSRRVASPMRLPTMRVIVEDTRAGQAVEDTQEMEDKGTLPNPVKAAGASAFAFTCGSLVPLLSTMFIRENEARLMVLVVVTSIALIVFGGFGAYLGGSHVRISAVRVLVGGGIAMVITYSLLKPFDKDNN